MKHAGSTLVILLFLGISYFILPHRPFSQRAAAEDTKMPVTPSASKVLKVSLTPTPSPTSRPMVEKQLPLPTPTPANAGSTWVQAMLLQQVNAYRMTQGLPAVTANATTCAFAAIRANELTTNFSHNGFTQRLQSKTLLYPSYSLITENIAENSNIQNVVAGWISSPEHAANMRADTPYACIAYTGNYYAYEGWKP